MSASGRHNEIGRNQRSLRSVHSGKTSVAQRGRRGDGGTLMKHSISRARLAVSAAVTAGLCLTGTAALTTPSQAAPGVCDTAFPVANLTPDQLVHGLT